VGVAAQRHFGRSCVDNSCAAGYDLSDVTGMSDGDTAMVPADPMYGGPLFYIWDEDSGLDESLPNVKDSDIAGNGRWILQTLPIPAGGTGATTTSGARANLGVQALDAFLTDIANLTDPAEDRCMMWDDSAGDIVWCPDLQIGDILMVNSSGEIVWLDANDNNKDGYILQLVGIDETGICTALDTPYGCCTGLNTGDCAIAQWVNTLQVNKIVWPGADDPTTADEGECEWDTNNRALECYDDSSQILSTMRKASVAVIPSPENLPDSIVTVFDAHEAVFPFGIVLKAAFIDCSAKPAADYVVTIEEWTDGNDNTQEAYSSDCGTLTLTGNTDYENEITSFSDASIAAGNLVKADFDDTDWDAEQSLLECRIGIVYEIEDGN